MIPITSLIDARFHQTRGSVKETWGKMSGRNGTRLEGQVERLSGVGKERLLRTEVQGREQIERAVQRARENMHQVSASLVDTTNQALGRPAKRKPSRIWIPAVGGAVVLTGLGLAVFSPNGPWHDALQRQEWWGKLSSTSRAWLERR